MPASAPTEWVVGAAIGRQLREAGRHSGAGATHASPRPHIRRAHWHHFRVGEGRQQLRLRWLHPLLVGTRAGESPVVVHPVREGR